LDTLSRSYTEQEGQPVCPALKTNDFNKRLDAALARHEGILAESLLARHTAFELPWFMALLTRARKKGVLASSQFLWLRPLDRPLWYALHQCGGRAAWAEGFAAWAHFVAEEKAGKTLNAPNLAPAVTALRDALSAQGWLSDKPRLVKEPESVPGNPTPKPEPEGERVEAEAEDDLEALYDANDDPSVRNQIF